MFVYVVNIKKALRIVKISIVALVIIAISAITGRSVQRLFDIEANTDSTERVIIIDAGHGGEDCGAIGVTGVFEKNINLDIALLIGEELKSKGYTVLYTRTEDKMLYSPEENIKGMKKISDLKNRCKIASSYTDSILISIHMNSFGSSKYSGLQVYYSDGDYNSRLLADKIQSAVRNNVQPDNQRQIKNGKSLYILDNSKSTSVIVECGFLSNAEECKKLSEKEYQKELSFSIVCGIIEYIEKTEGTV